MTREYIPQPVPLNAPPELAAYLERELNDISEAILKASEPDFGGMTNVSIPDTITVSPTPQPIPFDSPLIGRGIIYDPADFSLTPLNPGSAFFALTAIFDVQQQTTLRVEVYADGVPTGIFVEIEIIQQQDREDITLTTLANLTGAKISFWISATSTQTIQLLGATALIIRV